MGTDVSLAACPPALVAKLRLIDDLRERLVYVNWDRETFAMLARVSRDALQAARAQSDCDALGELLDQLERQTRERLSGNQLPQAKARERLIVLLEQLRYSLKPPAALGSEGEQHCGAREAAEILLVVPNDAWRLGPKLSDAGFKVRHIASLEEARILLPKTNPAAIIVDVDFPEEVLAGIVMISELRSIEGLKAPVFFLSERSDLSARMEAVWAGGEGYFPKPVDTAIVVERLQDLLLRDIASGYRVLIVDDVAAEAEVIASVLQRHGIATQTLTQPMQLIKSLARFRPDALLIDLDLKAISGLELIKIIRQHEACDTLPMILISGEDDPEQNIAALSAGADEILCKPVSEDHLLWALRQRLRRLRTLHARLDVLNNREAVSGLYNRRYWLNQLERLMNDPLYDQRRIAVMLIALDNLRAIQEARDVSIADQVVRQAAKRMQRVLGVDWRPARFGDVVFAAINVDAEDETLLGAARSLISELENEVYDIDGDGVSLRICIGIGVAAQGERDYLKLLHHADIACSLAREAQSERIRIRHLQADCEEEETQRRQLLEKVREALEQERISLLFQPIVSLRGDRAERYEVFLRIYDAEGLELATDQVFQFAQQYRLGVALDRWVIAQSIRMLRQRQAGDCPTTLFVNISPAILQDDAVESWLRQALEKAEVNAENLVFEMAETIAEEHLRALSRFLDGVKSLGCGFLLERFGRRNESLSVLKNLPVNYVKLDPWFVQDLAADKNKQKELQRLTRGLNDLGVSTVVGGVEDPSTLSTLWSCGINCVQGYFLQRPHAEMNYDFSGGLL